MSRSTPYGLDQRSELTAEPPFNISKLRDLICTALGDRYAPPGDAETERLCGILNKWHAWFYEAQELRKFNTVVERAVAAIETLRSVLPVIGRHHQKKAEAGDIFAKWQMDAAADLYAAINKDPARVTGRDSLPDNVKDWRWLAEALPEDINNTMRPTNPRFPAGRSKGGPVSRILEAVIPPLTGETVTATAIGNQLILVGQKRD